VIHRGARSAIEFAGHADFLGGNSPPLARPVLRVAGVSKELATEGIAWERALGWLPTFTCPMGALVVRGTVFAPHGRDADVAGAVYTLAVENRGSEPAAVSVALEGTLGHRQQRVRSPRPFDDAHRVARADHAVVVLEGSARPGLVALALGTDGDATVETTDGDAPSYAIRRELVVPPGGRVDVAFYLAAGPERDGAEATVAVMRRRGWRDLLGMTRDALQGLEQTTGNEQIDRLINRQPALRVLLCRGPCARRRALLSRSYAHAVAWSGRDHTRLGGARLDPPGGAARRHRPRTRAAAPRVRAARLRAWAGGALPRRHAVRARLLARGCRLVRTRRRALHPRHGRRPDRRRAGARRHPVPLGGRHRGAPRQAGAALLHRGHAVRAPRPHPYTLHGNAVVAQALEVLRRTLDEETARGVEDPEAVRAAIARHFAAQRDGRQVLANATDLPARPRSTTTRSARRSGSRSTRRSSATTPPTAARARARRGAALARGAVRAAGRPRRGRGAAVAPARPARPRVAAEEVDAAGRATANGGDAAVSGLLAYMVWYAVHVLGVRP
jgi:hypothetical protein